MNAPDPMTCQTVIRRKAEDSNDRAGAVCELVTALCFGLRKLDQEPRRHYYRARTQAHPHRNVRSR